MTMDETTKPVLPQTLAEAHEAVAAIRPSRTAPLTEWLAYHQQSAALYAEVAEIDRGHHHETLFMAERERQSAKEIKTKISHQHPTREEGR
ncbi:MAG: AMED_5909 family protein [Pseudonocardiaceae bacterium]